MEQGPEQNKTEEATPFKLRRARKQGSVARGVDLGFFSAMSGFALFVAVFADNAIAGLGEACRRLLVALPNLSQSTQQIAAFAASLYGSVLAALALLGIAIVFVVVLFEIVQVGGVFFTTKPLKPDFNRLNPVRGLKRLFSLRMLKETLKNIFKLAAYALASFLAIKHGFDLYAHASEGAPDLGRAMRDTGFRLLFSFILIALFVAALDQALSRQEFRKQMRMSRSELTREHKEREGEPRLKQKRKQLHASFASQTRAGNALAGSDMLIVNPHHYAVALAYDASRMDAPCVTAKGVNRFALQLKRRAGLLSIAIFEQPKLARALFRACEAGDPIPAKHYRAVADLYLEVMRTRRSKEIDDAGDA
jgi:flagellar biosynthetic protein FlhB